MKGCAMFDLGVLSSGSGLSDHDYDYNNSNSNVRSHLCFFLIADLANSAKNKAIKGRWYF
jgi:hypothetical protein